MIPIFVINLEADVERLRQITDQLNRLAGIEPTIVKALPGSLLCNLAYEALTDDGSRIVGKGALGCFLSHVSAWEKMVKGGWECGIILEDDVQLDGDFLSLEAVDRPSWADLIFINDRMCLEGDASEPLNFRSIGPLLERLEQTRNMGTDGYFLTLKGAEKLIAACQGDGFFGHVDGRLLRYMTTQADLKDFDERDSWISPVVRTHHSYARAPSFGIVRGGCLSRPLVRHNPIDSSRERENSD